MEISPELRERIEGLYSAFTGYPLKPDTNACPCCHSEEDERMVHRKPLRQLGPEHLQKYATDALLVWGDEDTYRHFLPRIYELVATLQDPDFSDVGQEALFARLRYGVWWTWPESERNAIRAYLKALWQEVLNRPQDRNSNIAEIEDWLRSIAQAEPNLQWYLDHWLAAPGLESSFHLACLAAYTDILQPRPSGWMEAREQLKQLQNWVNSSAVKAKLMSAAQEWPSEPVIELAASVVG